VQCFPTTTYSRYSLKEADEDLCDIERALVTKRLGGAAYKCLPNLGTDILHLQVRLRRAARDSGV
jgi:hypothetical protein